MPNADQIEYWNGPAGEHWGAEADRYDRIDVEFGERIVVAVDAAPGERVLDVGCGNGALSVAIGSIVAPGGSVLGLDVSGPMLAVAARRRASEAGLGNVTFERGDAQVHPLPDGAFDAVVSRFGVMFFDDPVAAFANLARTLRPGGRIVFTCSPGQPGPFSLADRDRIQSVMPGHFVDISVDEVVAPMRLGDSIDDVVAFLQRTDLAQTLMKDVNPEIADAAWAAIGDALEPYATADGVALSGATWLVQGHRPD